VSIKDYYANQKIFKKKLLSKKAKLKFSWTTVRPAITYVIETWELKECMKRKLLTSERNILKRMFGSAKDRRGTWKIKKKI
jgi:hypothetical protein